MRVSNFTSPRRDDFPGIPDGFFEKIIGPIAKQIEDLTSAVQGSLGPDINLNTETRDLVIDDAVPVDVRLQNLRGKPLGAILLESEEREGILHSQVVSEDVIRITVDYPSAYTDVAIRVLVVGK